MPAARRREDALLAGAARIPSGAERARERQRRSAAVAAGADALACPGDPPPRHMHRHPAATAPNEQVVGAGEGIDTVVMGPVRGLCRLFGSCCEPRDRQAKGGTPRRNFRDRSHTAEGMLRHAESRAGERRGRGSAAAGGGAAVNKGRMRRTRVRRRATSRASRSFVRLRLTSARVTTSPLSLVLLQGSRRRCRPVGGVPARLPESRPQQRQGLDGARDSARRNEADPEGNVGRLDCGAQPLRRGHSPEGTDRAQSDQQSGIAAGTGRSNGHLSAPTAGGVQFHDAPLGRPSPPSLSSASCR
jgi:hypothetical protein